MVHIKPLPEIDREGDVNMYELIEVLRAIESDDTIKAKEYLTDGYHNDLPDLIKEAVSMANDLLIIGDGTPNIARINTLREYGYSVFAGEKDYYGWLTGCIDTVKGIIVFG